MPFTDVLLVLLIIFMILASLAIPPGFERQLGNCACGAARMTHPKHIPVTVTQRGDILIERYSRRFLCDRIVSTLSMQCCSMPFP